MKLHLVPVVASLVLAACGGVKTHPSGNDGDGDDGLPDAPSGGDHLAPAIASITPADGAVGVHPDATITIVFSEPMDQASVEAAWQSDALPAASVAFAWNETSDTVVVTPAQALLLAEGVGTDPSVVAPLAYSFGLAGTAADAAGNPLGAAVTTSFTTQRAMTVAFIPISSLTRSMRGDGVVFGEAAVTLTSGDTIADLQTKTFVAFTLPVLPSDAMVATARLSANQNSTIGKPYSVLGKVVALHVNTPTIDAIAFGAAPLGNAGTLSASATAGAKTLDVTDEVADDLANHVARGDRSQFRLELTTGTNNDGIDDEARFSRTGMTLTLTYLVD